MIRPLADADRDAALAFLSRDPELTLFMTADLLHYGVDTDTCRFWGEFDARGRLRALLMQYLVYLVFHARGPCDRDGFRQWSETLPHKALSGERSVVTPLLDPATHDIRHMSLVRLRPAEFRPAPGHALQPTVRRTSPADVERILDLYRRVPEFDQHGEEALRSEYSTGHARGWFIEVDGRMVAIAQVTAQTLEAAMVVGVCTDLAWRGRGLAEACMRALIADVATPAPDRQPRALCLFFDNPLAGRLYRKLGFSDMAQWTVGLRRA